MTAASPEMMQRVEDRYAEQFRYELWKVRRGELREKQRIDPPFVDDVAIIAGLGWGKNEALERHVVDLVDNHGVMAMLFAGPTKVDTYSVMVHGNQYAPGIMNMWPEHMKPTLLGEPNPHVRCHTGCMIYLRSGQKAHRMRGLNVEFGWADELDYWKPEQMTPEEALTIFDSRCRVGANPRRAYTSTPHASRGGRLCRTVSKREGIDLRQGSSYENKALPQSYIDKVLVPLEGTRRGREEVYGEILDTVVGALIVAEKDIDPYRVFTLPDTIIKYVIGVDPSGSKDGDEVGIVVVGVTAGPFPHAYIVADRSGQYSPDEWGTISVQLAIKYDALVVAEKNYGGEMVSNTVHQAAHRLNTRVRVELVTARLSKPQRVATVSPFYENGEVHSFGNLPEYEAEMCSFTDTIYVGTNSPGRADAGTHALRHVLPIKAQGYSLAELYAEEEAA